MKTNISFDNTEIAFAAKSNDELKQAHWLFELMGKPWVVKLAVLFTPPAIRMGLPIKGLIRKTIFRHFVGGETMEACKPAIEKMKAYNVKVILDYGVEGKEGESNYDHACEQFIKVINFASTQPNVPYMSVKVTGIARFALMEKLDEYMRASGAPTLMGRYEAGLLKLSADELNEWQRVHDRIHGICETAAKGGVGFLVDAEETWIQEPLDALVMKMMSEFNKERLVIYNTLQMYRHDRLEFLKDSYKAAEQGNFLLGAKLVRGAYLEKERKRAVEKSYRDPIQPDKESTDRDYDDGVRFCIERIERAGLMVASHNERSNMLAAELLQEKGIPLDHPHVHFSQLYGMSDNVTYNLARAGFSASKYLPFGPIGDVIPYLMRRAQENTSVGGQTSRELRLIEKELMRRKM